jgi:hypothetical protein
LEASPNLANFLATNRFNETEATLFFKIGLSQQKVPTPRTLPNSKHNCFFIGYMKAKEFEKKPDSSSSNIELNGVMNSPNCNLKLSLKLETFFTEKC